VRVLILGGNGMFGHKLVQQCKDHYETWVTLRSGIEPYHEFNLFAPETTLTGIDASEFDTVVHAFAKVKPEVAINCIGIIKQLPAAHDPIPSITVNALFPHRLAALCRAAGIRLIHLSTDCVFSGRKGMYTEQDSADAEDLYGRSKLLGEVQGENCLTLRTSIIGPELKTTSGLLEWFLQNQGASIRGYTNAVFSGFTTLELANIIINLIENHRDLAGLFHVSSDPITKFDLLAMIRDVFSIRVEILPWPDVHIDRSLDSSRFREATGFSPRAWSRMIADMAADRRTHE
jgi:dTDP-4-dehydrorhamnose reductase